MRFIQLWFLTLFQAALAFAGDVERDKYQRIVAKHYPGFRILSVADFTPDVQAIIGDGTNGALIVGHFNFDDYADFAALIVGSTKKRYGGSGKHSYVYFDGKEIKCYGREDITSYVCETSSKTQFSLPHWWYLKRVAPGTYSCLNGDDMGEWTTITTEADSVGEVFPEKAAGFSGTHRNGVKYECATSD